MSHTLKQVIDNANTFHGPETLDLRGHNLTSDNLMTFRDGGDLRFKEGNVFKMNDNVIYSLVEDVSGKACSHDCEHKW
jgi:hypothetical protein